MKAVSGTHMRAIESAAIQQGLVDSWAMMTIAGEALAQEAAAFRDRGDFYAVLAGKGNNAGDGFVAAKALFERGCRVRIFHTCPASEFKGDALRAWSQLPDGIERATELHAADLRGAVVIDALLGTGFSGALREPWLHWINLVNYLNLPVIAADLPSGLDADDGEVRGGAAVRADVTVTFGFPKTGMLTGRGPELCGRIRVVDIGLPDDMDETVMRTVPCTGLADVRRSLGLHPVEFDTYKQKRGHVAVIGGSRDYPSAPFLTAEAALRAGAGLVTVYVPASMEIVCAPPKALIVKRLPDDGNGVFSAKSAEALNLSPNIAAIAAGMGMNTAEETVPFLRKLMASAQCPLLLDADALNLIAKHPDLLHELGTATVVTPHEGEMKRLEAALGLNSGGRNRVERAEALARLTALHVVLKGVRTVVMSPNGLYSLNLSGSPVLATAGSGDVLSGIIAALAPAPASLFTAAKNGVFVHGLLGELDAPLAGRGLIADDLLLRIPRAFDFIRTGGI
ncbi:MAG: NAD(P)H-hydrate dehydratase [Lentisphaeria bacterium]|nr:NAD(P)H-hydrate dehydratase [Lentisphaeria bacterium]